MRFDYFKYKRYYECGTFKLNDKVMLVDGTIHVITCVWKERLSNKFERESYYGEHGVLINISGLYEEIDTHDSKKEKL